MCAAVKPRLSRWIAIAVSSSRQVLLYLHGVPGIDHPLSDHETSSGSHPRLSLKGRALRNHPPRAGASPA